MSVYGDPRPLPLFDLEAPEPTPGPAFHARAHVRPAEAVEGEAKNSAQNEEILRFFRENGSDRFTPWEIHAVFDGRIPITSIRRGMTDMAKNGGPLQHHETDRRQSGPHGGWSGTWSLRNETVPA